MRINPQVQYDFQDVLIRPMNSGMSSRNSVDLVRDFKFPGGAEWSGVPIMVSNMDAVGTLGMAEEMYKHGIITILHKFYSPVELIEYFESSNHYPRFYGCLGYSIGTSQKDLDDLDSIWNTYGFEFFNHFKFIVVDVANGYMNQFVESVRNIRKRFPDHVLVAGNVVTHEQTHVLIGEGADIVKVGIGSGSVCRTRMVTGVGRPQLSAVDDCADYAHQLRGFVCSDGGIQNIGDFSKAFVAGADFVMAGNIFAPYSTKFYYNPFEQKRVVTLRGMASEEAMIDHYGEIPSYRTPEGVSVKIDWKGPPSKIVHDILGGLRSAGTYIGADRIKDFPKKGSFYIVNRIH